ncbi:hypothetical protein SAMN06265337_3445 [Hymenobacter gelipurpurascens]|uniref:SpoIIAA-like n=1 Tax=Hymenobacter gelipurpurascens TaxID=89968 RepID=A0A212UE72_9BACT|nr:hypothetical protein [Hymenobacter gelipurpurascens]SNC76555.1 hypothetical protein SAMN06265337_3445 [Hymenobacter gelipurpurascens]
MNSPVNRLFLENAVGRVEEDVHGFIRLQYHPGPRNSNSWQALMQHAKELLARQGRGLMLIDQQRMAPFKPAEQTWLLEQWLPSAIVDGGYRYGAILQAHDVFARLAMDTVRTQARDLHLTYRYFTDEAAAVAWLLAQYKA